MQQVPLVAGAYERMAFHEAAHAAVAISSRGNLLLQETAPWTAFKKVPDLYNQPSSQDKFIQQMYSPDTHGGLLTLNRVLTPGQATCLS